MRRRRRRIKKGICGKHFNTNNCFELEKNKDKRPAHWKSMLEQDETGLNNDNKEIWKPGRVILNRNKRDKDYEFNAVDLNYWTPLTDQVEESDQEEEELIDNILN